MQSSCITASLQCCDAAHHLATIVLHCIARCCIARLLLVSAASALRPSSISCECRTSYATLSARTPPALICCFLLKQFFARVSVFNCLCHAQLFSRSSFRAARALAWRPFRATRARATRPHCYEPVAPLRSASYLRSTLPAAVILPCAYTHLPSGTAVILISILILLST